MEKPERIGRELLAEGSRLKYYKDTMKIPNGNIAYWDFVKHKGAAAVLPVMPDGRIIMVRQYRNALNRETLEIPAGGLDTEKEPSIVCATRELEEETGYKSAKPLEKLVSVATAIAFCDEVIDIYLADDLVKSEQRLDEDEYINVEMYTIDELKKMVYEGKIQDSKSVAAILAYAGMRK